MDKKLKAKWLKALRDGKIKQGRGELLNETAPCAASECSDGSAA